MHLMVLRRSGKIMKWTLHPSHILQMLISSMLIKKHAHVIAMKGWITRVCVLAKHDWMSEVLLSTAGCRTQVQVPQEGGLGCKERRLVGKCQRLVPLTLLQQSVIHETAPFPSLPNSVRGGGLIVYQCKRTSLHLLVRADHRWASGIFGSTVIPQAWYLD